MTSDYTRRRYLHDAMFHAVVDSTRRLIREGLLDADSVRDAVAMGLEMSVMDQADPPKDQGALARILAIETPVGPPPRWDRGIPSEQGWYLARSGGELDPHDLLWLSTDGEWWIGEPGGVMSLEVDPARFEFWRGPLPDAPSIEHHMALPAAKATP